jgi:hypothetical protein
MAKKDLSYKYDKCNCGEKKLKVSANCQRCRAAIQASSPGYSVSKPVVCSDGCCLVCKTKLKPKQKAFCGLKCRFMHIRIPERQCKCCRQLFKPKSAKIKYCTNECANRHKAELYRNPDSKMQQSKTTANGCKRGACCRLNYSPCIQCGGKRSTLKKQKFCSQKCARKQEHANRVRNGTYRHQSGAFTCYCGKRVEVTSHANMRTTCSRACARTERRSVRRARMKSKTSDRGVNWRSAVRRFGWACASCNCYCVEPTGKNLMNEATLDHICPLSKGGTHTWDNVQVMCRKCNTLKRDRQTWVYNSDGLTK